ncbi:DUF6479 family protein [Embleya sp. NPDC050154]|uniref:DUF6479 family protein n=1 Tax=Embleya sp. NPDC050154 TaxID=3363988 RepID=UPI0037B2B8DD
MVALAQFASASPGTVAGVAIVAVLLIAVLLIIPVVSGVRRRRRPPPAPPRDLPTASAPDPGGENREPAPMPRDGRLRGPHEMPGYGNLGSRPAGSDAHEHDKDA